jgi:uncharacterized protein YjbJ (UPF0337 family)
MNKDELRGKLENLKGRAKAAVGSLTGNKQREAEGHAERFAGAAREKVGEAEEAVKRGTDPSRDEDVDDED